MFQDAFTDTRNDCVESEPIARLAELKSKGFPFHIPIPIVDGDVPFARRDFMNLRQFGPWTLFGQAYGQGFGIYLVFSDEVDAICAALHYEIIA